MRSGRPYIRLFYKKPKQTAFRRLILSTKALRGSITVDGQGRYSFVAKSIKRSGLPNKPIPTDGPGNVYSYRTIDLSPTSSPPFGQRKTPRPPAAVAAAAAAAKALEPAEPTEPSGAMNKGSPRPSITSLLAGGLSEMSQSIKSYLIAKRMGERRDMSGKRGSRARPANQQDPAGISISSLWKPIVTKPRSELKSLFSRLFTVKWNRAALRETRRRLLRREPPPRTPRSSAQPTAQNLAPEGSIFKRLFEKAKSYYLPEPDAASPMLVDVKTDEFASFANAPDPKPESTEEYRLLNGSATSLVASDFQRLIRGTHIKSWEHRFAIYQAYNRVTYSPLDQYVLRFRNPAEALAFKTAFEAADTRDNPHFTIAPPGEERERQLSFHKIDPSSSPTGRTPAFDFAGAVKKRLGAPHAVHVRLEHAQARLGELRDFIEKDGEARGNLQWGLHRPYFLRGFNDVKDIARQGTAAAVSVRKKARKGKKSWANIGEEEEVYDQKGDDGTIKRLRLVRKAGIIPLASAADLAAYNDADWADDMSCLFGDKTKKGGGGAAGSWKSDFAVGFVDQEEARRFVRRFHKRFVTLGAGEGREVLMNVRLLNGGLEGYH